MARRPKQRVYNRYVLAAAPAHQPANKNNLNSASHKSLSSHCSASLCCASRYSALPSLLLPLAPSRAIYQSMLIR